jgi:hypothetical protein
MPVAQDDDPIPVRGAIELRRRQFLARNERRYRTMVNETR